MRNRIRFLQNVGEYHDYTIFEINWILESLIFRPFFSILLPLLSEKPGFCDLHLSIQEESMMSIKVKRWSP